MKAVAANESAVPEREIGELDADGSREQDGDGGDVEQAERRVADVDEGVEDLVEHREVGLGDVGEVDERSAGRKAVEERRR